MQFKHPEILYALFLVIIPIIVHLFQLQKFAKVPFTNVKFLKKIEQQTRKSARLKKWLTLITRILAFSCIIIAFSQPYFSKYTTQQNFETSIYLDNSYSMQAKGESGELLKSIAQEIIENTHQKNNRISILTNDNYFKGLDETSLKNNLISIKYSPYKIDLNTVLLKLNQVNSNQPNTIHKSILISDFQKFNLNNKLNFTSNNTSTNLLKVTPKNNINFFIDSVYVEDNLLTDLTINAIIKCTKNTSEKITVSLFNNSTLIGKTTAVFSNSNKSTIEFSVKKEQNFNGKLTLQDSSLEFDNDFFFTITNPEKINVLTIGENSSFLKKIYTLDEFNYKHQTIQQINYNIFNHQHLIILNELVSIPTQLISSLQQYFNSGGNIVVIPSKDSEIATYNNLLNKLALGSIGSKIENEHFVTTINYEHPIVKNVFEKRISNFKYPKTSLQYSTNLLNSTAIVNLDSNKPFVSSSTTNNSSFYLFNSPLNINISNFIQSPLVVPIFYNFAKHSLQPTNLYYYITSENEIPIYSTIGKDQILKMSNGDTEFIPLQNAFQNKVILNLQNQILKSGFYSVSYNNSKIKTLAFNYPKQESELEYLDLQKLSNNNPNVEVTTSTEQVFDEISNQGKINWLFKWFLAFSILFLFLEMLILKYFNI
ncbi:BatA domain-containing protein [uncultured Lutibacter sp.]|uniref:BatA domain-containing protein n=1 Tax=uncultured Lutibacter sp. TaxID=437739 RepID=UPI002628D32E|nr:BatA domain-containing protein [uncultured Lutibacter sp.]